jgi:hypothetical protein
MAKNKLGIPAVRDRLRELADEYGIDELHDLADQMYRKSAKKRAPVRSPKLTPEMAEEIRQLVCLEKIGPILKRAFRGTGIGGRYGTSTFYA